MELPFWIIYDHPRDYPDHWVMRVQYSTGHGILVNPMAALCGSLAEAREHVPPGAIQIGPEPGDDPVIAGVWI